ncbi:hypothetical protein KKG05_09660, partial [bacterium]|nr:hypothetical protein [bacterium]
TPDKMKLLLVLDGGGTRTRAIVAPLANPSAPPFGTTEVGPSNFNQVGANGLQAVIHEIIGQLAVPSHQIHTVVAGLAGVGREEERQQAEDVLCEIFPDARILVHTDAELAYEGAFGSESGGILIIAGTGSIAWTRLADGHFLRAGGWGALLGDDGSGAWLGREALRLCLRQEETKSIGLLAKAILKSLNLTEANRILNLVYQQKYNAQQWASLAPLVFEFVGKDREADKLIQKTGTALAELAHRLLAQMDTIPEQTPVVVCGGLTTQWPLLEPSFRAELERENRAKFEIIKPLGDALFGGRLIAQR